MRRHFSDIIVEVLDVAQSQIFTLALSSGKRNVTVMRQSVRPSVPFSPNLNRALGVFITVLVGGVA